MVLIQMCLYRVHVGL